jgi:hypothetical protein
VGGQDDGADVAPGGGMSEYSTRPAGRFDLPLGSPPGTSASDAVTRYLDHRTKFPRRGASPDKLGRVRKLPRSLGDPQDALRAVHVAGHGGKGVRHRFWSLRF